MRVKAAILRNVLAGGGSKVSTMLFRLIQVPLLLSTLGVEEFGRWVVLASLPTWLTLANLGFGSVAANEMSMAVAAGQVSRARSIFSTTIALVLGLNIIGILLCILIAPAIPLDDFLGVASARHDEITTAVTWMAFSVFISFSGEAFAGRLRAARKAHIAVTISSFRPWLDLLAMVIALHFSTRLDKLAMALFASTVIFLALLQWLSSRGTPELAFSFAQVSPSKFKTLFQKGVAFQAFPLGNALFFQGNLLIIQVILGPGAVAAFATARTVVRSVNQLMDIGNQAIWPELSHLLGAGDFIKAARLHRMGVCLSLAVATLGTLGLLTYGTSVYSWWTANTVELPLHIFALFSLSIPLNALWITSAVVHYASNQHEKLATRYMMATLLALTACAGLSYSHGLAGAAISTLVLDIILIPFVLKRSLVLTRDSWSQFTLGVLREGKPLVNLISLGRVR